MNHIITRHDDGRYCLSEPVPGEVIVNLARNIVAEAFERPIKLTKPTDSSDYLVMQLAMEQREVFGVIFVDRQNQVLAFEKLFFGTVDATSVYPREVVKRCLQLNATAVILTHNHPSGHPEPSQADINITSTLVKALKLIDVNVLDHIVIGGSNSVSFAERGMI